MATSEHVRRLIDSHDRGDERAFRAAVADAASDARAQHQDTLALDLEKAAAKRTRRKPVTVADLRPLPVGRDDLPLVTLHEPDTTFRDLVLRDSVLQLLDEVVREHRNRGLLAAHGLRPRRRLLFVGPPGTGKTRTAAAIASSLGVPVAKVRLSAVVSSYLGETSRHLEQIMDFAVHGTWVLVFDEIDMLGAERDRDDHGEMRRVVTAFLQTLEEADGHNLVIATTNHPAILDDALWRRFDEVVPFSTPTRKEIEALLEVKLRRMRGRVNRDTVSRTLVGMSHAEIEMVCLDAMRSVALDARDLVSTEDLMRHASERQRRLKEAGRSLT